MPRGALFDMDRTLIRTDTATLYVRYQRDIGEADWRDGVKLAWWLMQYTLGTIDAPRVARKVLEGYVGKDERKMIESCQTWFRSYVLEHVCVAGREAVERHRAGGDVLAIVTSATPYAARPLAAELDIEHVCCTEIEVDSAGRFTGEVLEPMCFGAGKIGRAEQLAREHDFSLDEAVFYSDSITDLPLLERVGEPICVNPDARLNRVARSRRWRVEHWV